MRTRGEAKSVEISFGSVQPKKQGKAHRQAGCTERKTRENPKEEESSGNQTGLSLSCASL